MENLYNKKILKSFRDIINGDTYSIFILDNDSIFEVHIVVNNPDLINLKEDNTFRKNILVEDFIQTGKPFNLFFNRKFLLSEILKYFIELEYDYTCNIELKDLE